MLRLTHKKNVGILNKVKSKNEVHTYKEIQNTRQIREINLINSNFVHFQ